MTYKSNIFKCMLDFIGLAIMLFVVSGLIGSFYWLLILEGEVGPGVTRAVMGRVLISAAIGSGIVAAFLAFYIRRIRVVVSAEAVVFSRGKRIYAYFPHESFYFKGYIHLERVEGVIPFYSRYLQVILRYGMFQKRMRCYNFTGKTFSDFLSQVRATSLAYQQRQQDDEGYMQKKGLAAEEADYYATREEDYGADYVTARDKDHGVGDNGNVFEFATASSATERTFEVNKEQLVKRHRKMATLLTLFCFLPVAILTLITMRDMADPLFWQQDFRMQPVMTLVSLILFLIPMIIALIPCIFYGRRFRRVKRHTPERIVVYPNRIKLDNEGISMTFSFERIQQIRMTIPDSGGQDTLLTHRVLTIKEDGQSYRFTLSDNGDIKMPKRRRKKELPTVFPEYVELYHMLQGMFVDQPEKFVGDV